MTAMHARNKFKNTQRLPLEVAKASATLHLVLRVGERSGGGELSLKLLMIWGPDPYCTGDVYTSWSYDGNYHAINAISDVVVQKCTACDVYAVLVVE